ncbi:unnamed protein product [Brassica napus]|uniref:(rape) hypothetical protein n=1 Tax=Brassica napus TaxID=3708 RepID=A0A816K8S3_BRANA|nr:unnamed protein product [Brassica napus]
MLFPTYEIFGPVAPLIRFITEKEAIRIANDTIAGIHSFGHIFLMCRWLHCGGVKQSGLGKE